MKRGKKIPDHSPESTSFRGTRVLILVTGEAPRSRPGALNPSPETQGSLGIGPVLGTHAYYPWRRPNKSLAGPLLLRIPHSKVSLPHRPLSPYRVIPWSPAELSMGHPLALGRLHRCLGPDLSRHPALCLQPHSYQLCMRQRPSNDITSMFSSCLMEILLPGKGMKACSPSFEDLMPFSNFV